MGLLKKLLKKKEPPKVEPKPVERVPKTEPKPVPKVELTLEEELAIMKDISNKNIKAESLIRAGELNKAKELLESNLNKGADTPATYRNLSYIYRQEQDLENEIRVLKAGLNNVNPRNEKHYNSLKIRLNEITNKSEPKEQTEREKLINKEKVLNDKLWNKNYYGSEESKAEFKELKEEKEEYFKNNPKDFIYRAVEFYKLNWSYLEAKPNKERDKILELVGMGLYYEELGEYDKAIEMYNQSININEETFKNEITDLKNEHGDGNYLYSGKAMERIEVCKGYIERNKIKELEAEAKELEETNPKEAIKKYENLNKVNPGLKKYDKAIFKIYEAEAKELEKTNPAEAIKKYEYLNEINPGLKKYDKRIEIVKKKL